MKGVTGVAISKTPNQPMSKNLNASSDVPVTEKVHDLMPYVAAAIASAERQWPDVEFSAQVSLDEELKLHIKLYDKAKLVQ